MVTTIEHIYDTEVLRHRMQGVKSYSINLKKKLLKKYLKLLTVLKDCKDKMVGDSRIDDSAKHVYHCFFLGQS